MNVLVDTWNRTDSFVDGLSEGFKFETNLSTSVPAVAAISIYLVSIPLLKKFMEGRKPFKLTWLVVLHNLFLSVASAVLLALISVTLYRKYHRTDAIATFCDPEYEDAVGRLTFLYFINYLLKYYELIDTAILILKGKPVIFLHWFHHPATLFLCWTQLYGRTGLQWTVIVLNLIVHTVMYLYYALAALKIRCWWKQYITMLQILQFVIDFGICWTAVAVRVFHDYFSCETCIRCSGTLPTACFGAGLLTSYLALFVMFYGKTYNKKKSAKKEDPPMPESNGTAHKNGHSNGTTRRRPRRE